MEYCQNCQKSLPHEKFSIHLGYCLRNIKKCELCHQIYDKNLIDQHNDQFHQNIKCSHCNLQFNALVFDKHSQTCQNKPILCQHCSLNIPKTLYDDHLKHCEARSNYCQKCNQPIQIKNYYAHLVDCLGTINQSNQSNSLSSNSVLESQSVRPQTYSYPLPTVTRIRFDSSSVGNNSVIRHQIRQIGTRIISTNSSNNTPPTNFTNYVSTSTQPTSNSTGYYTTYANSNYHSQNNIYRPLANYQSIHDQNQDPGLQAALMASLGYSNQHSAELYQQIQRQNIIEQQLKKQ